MRHFVKRTLVTILTFEAALLLRRARPKIVSVTGNVGKTSTKDAIFAVLKDHIHTRKSEKSYNSELSVPLTVLGLENAWYNPLRWVKNLIDGFIIALYPGDYPKVLVLEMGVDQPGDMARLTKWIKPDVAVITRLPDVPVHVEFFSSPEEVVYEKLLLLDALKSEGIFVYNNDDEKVREAAQAIRQQSIGYSRYSLSQFTVSGDQIVYDGGRPVGIEFTLTHLDRAALMRVNGSLGVQHAYNCASATAVGSVFGIGIEDAMPALREQALPPGRMRLLRGIKDTLIIDDTYNSSPIAAEHALQTLKELQGTQRKVAVLGDMLELGQYSVREHEKLGEHVASSADLLITVGIRARKIAEGALEYGMNEKCIYQYDEIDRARSEVKNLIKLGDTILVKASQAIRAEVLVKEIMLEPERSAELLVRQDPAWKKKKIGAIV